MDAISCTGDSLRVNNERDIRIAPPGTYLQPVVASKFKHVPRCFTPRPLTYTIDLSECFIVRFNASTPLFTKVENRIGICE
jgi:hypothetical protein